MWCSSDIKCVLGHQFKCGCLNIIICEKALEKTRRFINNENKYNKKQEI